MRKPALRLVWIVSSLLFLLSRPAQAQVHKTSDFLLSDSIANVNVDLFETPFGEVHELGVVDLRVRLTNLSGEPRQVELTFGLGLGGSGLRIRRMVSLQPAESQLVTETLANSNIGDARFVMLEVRVPGAGEITLGPLRGARSPHRGRSPQPFRLFTTPRSEKLIDHVSAWRIEAALTTPSSFPTFWGGYRNVDAVVAKRDDLHELTPEAQSALRNWIASGGHLILADGGADPSSVELSALFPDEAEGRALDRRFLTANGWGSTSYVAGRIDLCPAAILTTGQYSSLVPGSYELPELTDLAIPGVAETPSFGLLPAALSLIALVSVVLVHFLLWRRGRQIYILVTYPGIALLLTFAFVAAILLKEGLAIHGHARTLIYYDQTLGQAFLWEEVHLFGTMRPRGGLRLPATAEVFIDARTSQMGRFFERGSELVLSSGVFQPRVRSAFRASFPLSLRERLVIEKDDDGGYRALNGFADDIRWLGVRIDGRSFEAKNIAAGEAGELDSVDDVHPVGPVHEISALAPISSKVNESSEGTYRAYFESSGLVNWGTDEIASDRIGECVVQGRFELPESGR
ncbi:MAG: hypothetical protein RL885_11430 [Planctomycetota bacterium]